MEDTGADDEVDEFSPVPLLIFVAIMTLVVVLGYVKRKAKLSSEEEKKL